MGQNQLSLASYLKPKLMNAEAVFAERAHAEVTEPTDPEVAELEEAASPIEPSETSSPV